MLISNCANLGSHPVSDWVPSLTAAADLVVYRAYDTIGSI